MFVSLRNFGLASVAGLSFVVLAGCGRSEPEPAPVADHGHEHEDMPETFSAAVAELKEHAPEVKAAFDAGKPEDAHDALHYLGEMSGVMTELIDSSTLTPEQKTEAKEASETLFDQYMRLDTEVLHDASTELKYDDVASKIDESLVTLEALVSEEETPAAETPVTEEPAAEVPAEEEPAAEESLP